MHFFEFSFQNFKLFFILILAFFTHTFNLKKKKNILLNKKKKKKPLI